MANDCRLSPSGKLVHTYSNQWIILDCRTN